LGRALGVEDPIRYIDKILNETKVEIEKGLEQGEGLGVEAA
jgi:hypothetical protein